ncbi:MAG: xanthine dehydrogenase subunit D [Candidatus Planktophila sp.]|nr:xanthine dehydrogenase subunit D [Candidatus Planktophila sp.]
MSTSSLPTKQRDRVQEPVTGGVGENVSRPDGALKVTGDFAYSSDLWADGMLWASTLRSPHPHARIKSINIAPALKINGVSAVLTHDDVPGAKLYGLEIIDQPVLAFEMIRFHGEAIAIVAADHPETAKRAAQAIIVEYEILEPVVDADFAISGKAPIIHAGGNITRHVPIIFGPQNLTAEVVVTGEYEVGMQDQAPLGPESGLAIPADDGGIDLYLSTQWLHVDRGQLATVLGLPPEKVRLTLAGVGGAFGAREDLSMQAHVCLLAMRTGKPVKIVYSREESFFGHVHRHPGKLRYEHGVTKEGKLVYVKANIVLDGGAYASSSPAVCANAACFAVGPYEVQSATIDAYVAYTNNPPCGAMRGFGAVQTAFAYESQMDKIAATLGIDPIELRLKNAMAQNSLMPTGQAIDSAAPVAEILEKLRDMPLPPLTSTTEGFDVIELPGGTSNTTHGEGVRRGVGYAVGIKNVGFSEGFDDFSTAKVRLEIINGEPVVEVHTAAAEVGQGLVTLKGQIARTELGVQRVVVHVSDTQVGSAGSTSASRQSYITGGAVMTACRAVKDEVLLYALEKLGHLHPHLLHFRANYQLVNGQILDINSNLVSTLADLLKDRIFECTREYRHRPTTPIDPITGQGLPHVQFAFAGHRAVVDVDIETGLIKVIEMATVQDVGKALNPQAVEGQIEGGTAQGLGLAILEEILVVGGKVKNPSFTDYLIPTVLDMPPVRSIILEYADEHAPYGLRGVGEPPTISSTPAIVSAIRAATGLALTRIPIRPEHITSTM